MRSWPVVGSIVGLGLSLSLTAVVFAEPTLQDGAPPATVGDTGTSTGQQGSLNDTYSAEQLRALFPNSHLVYVDRQFGSVGGGGGPNSLRHPMNRERELGDSGGLSLSLGNTAGEITTIAGTEGVLVAATSDLELIQRDLASTGSGGTYMSEPSYMETESTLIPTFAVVPVEVPEPGTLALLGIGFLALGLLRRRQSRAQTPV